VLWAWRVESGRRRWGQAFVRHAGGSGVFVVGLCGPAGESASARHRIEISLALLFNLWAQSLGRFNLCIAAWASALAGSVASTCWYSRSAFLALAGIFQNITQKEMAGAVVRRLRDHASQKRLGLRVLVLRD